MVDRRIVTNSGSDTMLREAVIEDFKAVQAAARNGISPQGKFNLLVIPAEKYRMPLKVVRSSVPSLAEGITSMEIADSAGTPEGDASNGNGMDSRSVYTLNSRGWLDGSKECRGSIRFPRGCLVPLW